MLKNYLLVAFRNLRRRKGYAAINVFGLAVGMATAVLILLFVQHERNVNHAFSDVDQLHRIETDWKDTSRLPTILSFAPIGPAMQATFPDVENYFRYTGIDVTLSAGERLFRDPLLICSNGLFEMFDFPFLHGDPATALREPNSLVLTERQALKLFDRTDALGETVELDTWIGEGRKAFRITGVLAEPGYNSVSFIGENAQQMFVSFENIGDFFGGADFNSWMVMNTVTFVELAEHAVAADLEARLQDLVAQNAPPEFQTVEVRLNPLTTLYLDENEGAARRLVWLLTALAGLILLIACVNFVNLTTARSAERAREIGVRKAIGAERIQLTIQFLSDAVLLSLLAMIGAIALVEVLDGPFSTFTGRPLDLEYGATQNWLWLLGLPLAVGVLAGLYPAIYLSRLRPIAALKDQIKTGRAALQFRRALIVTQFGIAVALLIVMQVASQQVTYMIERDPGFDREQTLVISSLPREWTADGVAKLEVIRERMAALPDVEATSISFAPPGLNAGNIVRFHAPEHSLETAVSLSVFQVDAGYDEAFGLELAAGRFLPEMVPTDSSSPPPVVLNEAAVRALNLEDPVGRLLSGVEWNGAPVQVAGVVQDFNYDALHKPISPALYISIQNSPLYRHLALRLNPQASLTETVEAVQAAWHEVYPTLVFEHFFLDDHWTAFYSREHRIQQIAGIAGVLAVLIACLGMLGLVALSVVMRTKEIGIRKVLGATIPGLVALLSKEFLRLVGLAFLVAAPVAYVLLHRWLQSFAYHIDLTPTPFISAGLLALTAALLATAYQSIKAARANPVESLRYE